MVVKFPIFIQERDDGSVFKFDSLQELRTELEAIDVIEDEYEGWDSSGLPLSLNVENSDQIVISLASDVPEPNKVRDALVEYANRRGIRIEKSSLSHEPLENAYGLVKSQVVAKWRAQHWLKRFLSRF